MNRSRPPLQARALSGTAVVLTLTFLAFALRLYRLGAAEFWFDEAGSYFVAVKDYAAMLDYLRQAVSEHPPFYYLLLHEWIQWTGASEFALRYFSLVFGVLFVPLLYRFARREFGEVIGLGAALAAAFSPFMFAYSQEARMYTLLPLLALLALEAFLAVVRYGRRRDWLAYAAISLIGLATHYYFVLLFAGELLFLLGRWRTLSRAVLVRWGALLCAIAVLGLVWLLAAPGLLSTLSASLIDAQVPPWPLRVERVMRDLIAPPLFGYDFAEPLRVAVLLGWAPVAFAMRARSGTTREAQARALLFAVALGALLGIALLPRGVTGRQAGVMAPAVLVLLVLGLQQLFLSGQRRGALAFAFILLLFALGVYEQTLIDKEDWGAALAQLAREAQAGDAIVLSKPTAWPTLAYYHQRADVPVYYLPEPAAELDEQQVARFMQPILASHARIWLGQTGSNTLDPANLLGNWLARHAFAAQADYFRAVSFYLFVNGTAAATQYNPAVFGEHIRLEVLETNGAQLKPGDSLLLHLRWLSDERISGDDVVILQLVDARGAVWAERRLLPCGGQCLTSDWPLSDAVDDREAFVIPTGTPPDSYRLMLSLYDPRARAMLPVRDKTSLELPSLIVLPDPNAVVPPTTHPLAARFDGALQLVGYDAAAPSVQVGEAWTVELTWRADAPIAEDESAVFQWLDTSGRLLAERVLPIGTGKYPTSRWQPGEVIRQRFAVLAPENTAGAFQLMLQVRNARTQRMLPVSTSAHESHSPVPSAYAAQGDLPTQDAVRLATVMLRELDRSFMAPDMPHPLDVTLAGSARLVGYQTAQSRNALEFRLAWRALGSLESRQKVFVHLLNDAGQVVAQHDGEPAGGLRPTPGWQSGEYILDLHRVGLANVPPGNYRVEVGMYDPTTGERLPVTAHGAEQPERRLILTTVRVP